MTRIFAQLCLALYLAGLAAPCGLVPPHQMSGAETAGGTMCAGDDHGLADDGGAGLTAPGAFCGTDLAAPRGAPEIAAAAGHWTPAFDAAAVANSPVLVPTARCKPGTGPPSAPSASFLTAQRLLL